MIDYDTPDEDPIVAEVRRARERHAARFNYNLRAIMEDYQRRQSTSGRKYVSPSAPATETTSAPTRKAG